MATLFCTKSFFDLAITLIYPWSVNFKELPIRFCMIWAVRRPSVLTNSGKLGSISTIKSRPFSLTLGPNIFVILLMTCLVSTTLYSIFSFPSSAFEISNRSLTSPKRFAVAALSGTINSFSPGSLTSASKRFTKPEIALIGFLISCEIWLINSVFSWLASSAFCFSFKTSSVLFITSPSMTSKRSLLSILDLTIRSVASSRASATTSSWSLLLKILNLSSLSGIGFSTCPSLNIFIYWAITLRGLTMRTLKAYQNIMERNKDHITMAKNIFINSFLTSS